MSVDFGSMLRPDIIPGHPLERNMAALDAARAPMSVCQHYTHPRDGVHVQVMSAGGYSGDPLDDSNAVALQNMAEAWVDDDRNDGANAVENVTVDWHPVNGNGSSYTAVCVNASAIGAELLAEIIAAAESFADYPVLDEDDYSRRENDAWVEALDWATRGIPEAHLQAVMTHVAEGHYGNSDAGWVDDAWVTEAMTDLGLTRRRVRLETRGAYDAPIVHRLVMSEFGEWDEWRSIGRIYGGHIR